MLITAEHIRKFHNEKCILKDASFTIEETDKMALIGINGTGKTTFMRILAGLEHYDDGNIIKKSGIRIAYLLQEPQLDESLTILEQVMKNIQNQQDDTQVFEAKAILGKLGIHDTSLSIAILSGGQRKRVALAEVLCKPCDLLILDEPTNHLDHEMINWLEKYLIKFSKALFMVTHDRLFLERITNKIIEIDHGNIYRYEGNYAYFLEEKANREAMAASSEKKRQSMLRKELEWVRAGVQARGTKSKDRLDRFYALSEQASASKQGSVAMHAMTSRLGKKTIEYSNLSKAYGDHLLFHGLEYNVMRNDRIGILGPNGCGKSTLLKVLYKEIEPDSGEVIHGDTVKIAFFKQGYEDMDDNKRVLDYIREVSDDIETSNGHFSASQMLEQFLFDKQLQYAKIERLSGGERRRLYLLKVLMGAPNILFLDEPTNDLDIQTLQILEDYLDNFDGAIFVVSHDRYFLDRICDALFVFEGNGVVAKHIGGYSQFMELEKNSAVVASKEANVSYQEMKQAQRALIPSMSSKEKQEYASIDEDIATLEATIERLDHEMNKASDTYEVLQSLAKQRETSAEALEMKMERWMYLQEKQQEIDAFKKR